MNDQNRHDDYQPGAANEHGTGSAPYDPTGSTTSHDPSHVSGASGASATGATGSTGATGGGRTVTEEFRVSGEAVVSKVKELVREGNVRRITIKNDDGKVLIEIPLTIGVIGTVLLPVWAAIGAIAALVANLTISVEKTAEPTPPGGDSTRG